MQCNMVYHVQDIKCTLFQLLHLPPHVYPHLFPVPLEAALKRALVLVNKSYGVTKLMQDSRTVHKPKIHRKRLQRKLGGICTNVRPGPS